MRNLFAAYAAFRAQWHSLQAERVMEMDRRMETGAPSRKTRL